jgi:hypothetical protein
VAKPTKKSSSSKKKLIEYQRVNLSYKKLVTLMLCVGVILFATSGYVYYKNVFTNPDRVLAAMLNKSLQVNRVQRNLIQSGPQSSIDQVYYNTFVPQLAMQSEVQLREGNLQSGKVTKVTNETTGNATQDFVRYTSIELPEGAGNKDFGKVINVWGKRVQDKKTGAKPTFLNESIFSIVPFGNLSAAQRDVIIQEVNKQKLYNYQQSKVSYDGVRPQISYNIALKPESLLKVLSKYSEVTGVGDKEQLDPKQYKDSPDINIVMTVDLISRHVKSVKFTDTQRVENYGAYGLKRQITFPSESISIDELQSRLQQFQ